MHANANCSWSEPGPAVRSRQRVVGPRVNRYGCHFEISATKIDRVAPAPPRLAYRCVSFRQLSCLKTSPFVSNYWLSMPSCLDDNSRLAQAVLALATSVLGSLETASHPGNTQNRCPLAARRCTGSGFHEPSLWAAENRSARKFEPCFSRWVPKN